MDFKEKTCCFTGHRHISAEKYFSTKGNLRKEIIGLIQKGYRYFAAGGAIGFDTLAADTVISLKSQYPEIRLVLVLPCKNQDKFWNRQSKEEYRRIISLADKVTVLAEEYYSGCMQSRNRALIDGSSVCISYYAGGPGGTAYTVNYAKAKDVKVINIYE